MNPTLIAVIVGMALSIGAYAFGRHEGAQFQQAATVTANAEATKAREEAEKANAALIAKIRQENQSIFRGIQSEIRKRAVYVECGHDPASGVRQSIDGLLTGRPDSGAGAGVPAQPGAAGGRLFRRDDAQTAPGH